MEDKAAARVGGQRCGALCAAGSFQEGARHHSCNVRVCVQGGASSSIYMYIRYQHHRSRFSNITLVVLAQTVCIENSETYC